MSGTMGEVEVAAEWVQNCSMNRIEPVVAAVVDLLFPVLADSGLVLVSVLDIRLMLVAVVVEDSLFEIKRNRLMLNFQIIFKKKH